VETLAISQIFGKTSIVYDNSLRVMIFLTTTFSSSDDTMHVLSSVRRGMFLATFSHLQSRARSNIVGIP